MGIIVSLSEVVDAFETASDEMSSYVNRATGQVVTVTHEDLRMAKEEPDPDMPDWEQEVVSEARSILDSKDWLELPNQFALHTWQIMDRFGRSRSAEAERAAVAGAIHGSGAFRNFEATVRRLGIEKAWFAYKTRALEKIAHDWLVQNGLQPDRELPADS